MNLLFRIHRKNFQHTHWAHTKWSKLIHFNVYMALHTFSVLVVAQKLTQWISECDRESAFDSKYVANKWSDGILLNFISPTLCMHFTWKLAYAHYNWMVLLLLLPLGTLSIIGLHFIQIDCTTHSMYIYVLCNTSIFSSCSSIHKNQKKFIFVSAFFHSSSSCSYFPNLMRISLLYEMRSLKMCCYQSRLITWHINFPFE